MIKKILLFLSIFALTISTIPVIANEKDSDDIMTITRKAGYSVKDINKPKSSIVIDAKNGDILWEDNINEHRDPASMSKLFTLYLLFEDLSKGKLSLETTITATDRDQAISGIYEISNNKIISGVEYPIKDLIFMTAVPSSNAATVMIANYLSNNDASAFIDRINQKARELGMHDTFFSNASGAAAEAFKGLYNPDKYDLSAPNQTSAHDLAILTYHFLKEYPEIVTYTNQRIVKTMVGTPYEEEFTTYNYSLPGDRYGMTGVDGLKTGSSPSGAFNAIVTTKRNQKRLITIVMGVGDWSDQDGEFYRHPFINALTEKAFSDLKQKNNIPYSNLFHEKKQTSSGRPSAKKSQHEQGQSFFHKFERFVDRNHSFIFIGLAIFIVLVLILSLLAIH